MLEGLKSRLETALHAVDLVDLFLIRTAQGQAAATGAQTKSSAYIRVAVHLGAVFGEQLTRACTPPAPKSPPHPNSWGIHPEKVFPSSCLGAMLTGRTKS